jgi:hypothetical protein
LSWCGLAHTLQEPLRRARDAPAVQGGGAVGIRAAALAGGIALLALTTSDALADDMGRARVHAVMNSVFGAGTWRETGGFRTPERENELRAQGALTVPPGVLSRHSMGRPEAPGAYDIVVDGVSPWAAAARLRAAGVPFDTLFPEGAHGTQGAHLHIEPVSLGRGGRRSGAVMWTVSDPTPAERAIAGLHEQSERGDGDAQLRLGRTYAQGRTVSKDLIAAYVWTAMAASNGAADPATRSEATQDLAALTRKMKADELDQARRFVQPPAQAAAGTDCAAGLPRGGVPILLVGSGAPQLLTNTADAKASCSASTGPLAWTGALPAAPRATLSAN